MRPRIGMSSPRGPFDSLPVCGRLGHRLPCGRIIVPTALRWLKPTSRIINRWLTARPSGIDSDQAVPGALLLAVLAVLLPYADLRKPSKRSSAELLGHGGAFNYNYNYNYNCIYNYYDHHLVIIGRCGRSALRNEAPSLSPSTAYTFACAACAGRLDVEGFVGSKSTAPRHPCRKP